MTEAEPQQNYSTLQTKASTPRGAGDIISETYDVTEEDIANYVHIKEREVKEVIPLRITRDSAPLLYLINYNDGWEVVSGDKRTTAVLASCAHGKLDMDSLGEGGLVDGVFSWLSGEAAGISALRETPVSSEETRAENATVRSNVDFWRRISGGTDTPEGDGTRVIDPDTPIIPGPGNFLGHWEVFSVNTEYVVLSETVLNTAKWKCAAPYTTYINYPSQLGFPALVAGKMLYYLYAGWGITQTSSYYFQAPTIIWGNLSNTYNDYVGYYLACMTDLIMGGSDPYYIYDAYHVSYGTQAYDPSLVESTIVTQHRPIPVTAFNNQWLFIQTGDHTFLIDKFRTYDVVTTTTEVWVYDELPGEPFMHEEPLPRVTVTHSTDKKIAMNWGFSYNSEAGTDGDDVWFSLTDWNIFGNTYQYDRTMYYNFQQMAQ